MPYKLLIATKRTQIVINYAEQWLRKHTHKHTHIPHTHAYATQWGENCISISLFHCHDLLFALDNDASSGVRQASGRQAGS